MIQIFQIKCALPADSAHNCFQLCGTGPLDAAGMFGVGGVGLDLSHAVVTRT